MPNGPSIRSGDDDENRSRGQLALITFVKDRPGHDCWYAIDTAKIKKELGWVPAHKFEEGIRETVFWYVDNQEWVKQVLGKSAGL